MFVAMNHSPHVQRAASYEFWCQEDRRKLSRRSRACICAFVNRIRTSRCWMQWCDLLRFYTLWREDRMRIERICLRSNLHAIFTVILSRPTCASLHLRLCSTQSHWSECHSNDAPSSWLCCRQSYVATASTLLEELSV